MQLSEAKSWGDFPDIIPETQPMPETERLIRLRMTATIHGSLNGRDSQDYERGVEYDLPDQGEQGLGAVFLREGWAELVEAVGASISEVDAPAAGVRNRKRGG